jgi:dynein heavy chain
MDPIFEQHEQLMKSEEEKAQEALRTRRQQYEESLKAMAKDLDQFSDFGKVEENEVYNAKAKAINAKLEVTPPHKNNKNK